MYPHQFPHPALTSNHLIVDLDRSRTSQTAHVKHTISEAKSFLICQEPNITCLEMTLNDNPEWNIILDYFKLRNRLGMPLHLQEIILTNPPHHFITTLEDLGYPLTIKTPVTA